MAASPTAGTFTPTQLQKVIAKTDEMWADNQMVNDYRAEVEVLTAIRKEQTATLVPLQDKTKDRIVRLIWIADCNTGAEDCDDDEDDCAFTGPEAESRAKDYELDICGHVTFSISEEVFRTNEFSKEEVLAKEFLARFKELDEYLAQKTVAKLNSYAGENQYTGGIGTVDGVTTYIPSNYWTPDMYGYFNLVKIKNKFNNPYMIHGSNLFQLNWQNQFNVANANQKDGLPKLQSLRSYWDLFNIDAINSPDQVSYMIDKGAVAFVNKARYPLNNPVEYKFGSRWSVESKALPGVYYDVIYKERCVGEDVFYDYKMKVRALVAQNPLGCNEDKTGVLKFVCGTAPTES